MVAGADVGKDSAAGRALGNRARRKDVVDAPADVPLPHVAPRRPPGEQARIVGVERARDVDQGVAEQPIEKLALLQPLPDYAWLALPRVDVDVGARDVDVAAEDELAPVVVEPFRPRGASFAG